MENMENIENIEKRKKRKADGKINKQIKVESKRTISWTRMTLNKKRFED
jgi:hypothetical protein